jgi:hypothetical protein
MDSGLQHSRTSVKRRGEERRGERRAIIVSTTYLDRSMSNLGQPRDKDYSAKTELGENCHEHGGKYDP